MVAITQKELEVMRDTAVYLRAIAKTLGGDKEMLAVKLREYSVVIDDWVERVEVTAVVS